MAPETDVLERQISEWRAFVARGSAIGTPDVEELEGHLRDQIEALTAAGLDGDEAFLVAVKRIGSPFAEGSQKFYALNLGFFVLPFLAAYLAWKRGLGAAGFAWLSIPFAAMALVSPVYSPWALFVVVLIPLLFSF